MRHWDSSATDDGSVHVLGNGKLCVYEQGPQIIQAFGPPYSTSSFTRLSVAPGQGVSADSSRELGTAIWSHTLQRAGVAIGTMIDYVDSELPALTREIELTAPLKLVLQFDGDIKIINNTARWTGRYPERAVRGALLATAPRGRAIYNDYPMPTEICSQFLAAGALTVTSGTQPTECVLNLKPGRSVLHFVGGPRLPQCTAQGEALLALAPGASLARTREYWRAFTARRHDFAARIPQEAPEREGFLRAVDDVATIIKAQQGVDGAILAGSPFHLGYIRDQYGDFRCLLALGYLPEAKLILEHYWAVWRHYGLLHNAHGIGVDGIFHIHENDEVEITGYLIIQAFDYFNASGDEAFLRELMPMLEWAWEAQKRNLLGDMIPFNGDETYVAGGILPRTTLNDGAAEATMFFITGGELLLKWQEANKAWDAARLAENRAVLERVRANYKKNFIVDGHYITNNPARRTMGEMPRFRHGVCEGCSAFGWAERTAEGRYLCPNCFGEKHLPAAEPVAYSLNSVILMPIFVHSTLFGKDEIKGQITRLMADYHSTGRLPSRPDGNTAVGYDFGLLLNTLTALGDPAAGEIYEKMMGVIDPTGAWVEYYADGKPSGTRCRPWESGINLEAAINYLDAKYAGKIKTGAK